LSRLTKSRSRANGTVDRGLGGVSGRSRGGVVISQAVLILIGFCLYPVADGFQCGSNHYYVQPEVHDCCPRMILMP
jgi:hypothetical protein